MAFIELQNSERFSLLLLEPGEIYFKDYSVYLYPDNVSEAEAQRRRQKGRLKICSKSILFVPEDVNHPIMKVTHDHTTSMCITSRVFVYRIDLFASVYTIRSA